MTNKATVGVTAIGIRIGNDRLTLICLEVRCGSISDSTGGPAIGPLRGVKRTKTMRKRTWGSNVGFSIAASVKALSGYVMPHSFCMSFCTG